MTVRPTDVMVYEWVKVKHACVDLTRVFLLVGFGIGLLLWDKQHSKAPLQAKWSKMRKCVLTINVFYTIFIWQFWLPSIRGCWYSTKSSSVSYNNVVFPRPIYIVFKRIGFIIQKQVVTLSIVRSSFISI